MFATFPYFAWLCNKEELPLYKSCTIAFKKESHEEKIV